MPKIRLKTRILPVMIGTAGHVDHGKTALVKNLTGCETDHLAEEKKRGLSINLGFAACHFPGRRLAGVVDVPGHETFIRNMVAGAASMDIVMLVVAADDGVMPQTLEHMQIVKLLRTPRVLAVITKVDLVDADLVELVKQDLEEFLARMGFADAPIICASNNTLDGLAEIREVLGRMVERAGKTGDASASQRPFRMNVERAFTAKGYGTVVTGIPVSGHINVGDQVELLPSAKKSGIRFIQSYQIQAERVEASVCGALNLRHIDLENVRRGMTVAVPGVYRATTSVVVQLGNVSESYTLKRRTEVKLHAGTSVVQATCRLVDRERLEPGQDTSGRDAIAQIVLREPLVLAAGDRYILRSLSPVTTVGGGVVLSARGEARMSQRSARVRERLDLARRALAEGDFFMTEMLLGPSGILDISDLERFTQRVVENARMLIDEKAAAGDLIDLGAGGWLVSARRGEVAGIMKSTLGSYHDENPYSWGMEPTLVCKAFRLNSGSFPVLAEALCGDPEIILRNGRLALASFSPNISQQQMQMWTKIVERVKAGGARPPARGDLMRDLGISEQDMRILVKLLVEEGTVKVVRSNLMLYSLFEEFRQELINLFGQKEIVTIADFRERTGVSRNMAEALLESYDAEGMTRRVETGRILIKIPAGRTEKPAGAPEEQESDVSEE